MGISIFFSMLEVEWQGMRSNGGGEKVQANEAETCVRSMRKVLANSVLHAHILFAEVDQSLFQKKLSSSLRNHREYPQVLP